MFFPAFYRSGYKVGAAFLKSSVAMVLVVAFDIVGPHLPGFGFLDGSGDARQLALLITGAALWLLVTVFVCKVSAARYEKVDL